MLINNIVHNFSLEPVELEDVEVDIALKYYVLFAKDKDEIGIYLHSERAGESYAYLSKFDFDYPQYFLDDSSFKKPSP